MNSTVKMIVKNYYYDPNAVNQQTPYTSYAAALQAALDEYNDIIVPNKKLISVKHEPTTHLSDLHITDVIGGMAIILYEEFFD